MLQRSYDEATHPHLFHWYSDQYRQGCGPPVGPKGEPPAARASAITLLPRGGGGEPPGSRDMYAAESAMLQLEAAVRKAEAMIPVCPPRMD